jgi:hypothetical protein
VDCFRASAEKIGFQASERNDPAPRGNHFRASAEKIPNHLAMWPLIKNIDARQILRLNTIFLFIKPKIIPLDLFLKTCYNKKLKLEVNFNQKRYLTTYQKRKGRKK